MKPAGPPTVEDLLQLLEVIAPSWAAEDWDRVGLVAGQGEWQLERVWVALELSPELVAEAAARGGGAVVVHHNPLFHPLSCINPSQPATAMLLKAVEAKLAVVAAHTNLDAAPSGVNDHLARAAGLSNLRVLRPMSQGLAKVVVFVPPEALEQVARAAFRAGAGVIGDYEGCGFSCRGTGRFTPREGARPYQGEVGKSEEVEEQRFETVVPQARAHGVVQAIKAAHPYEEPVVEIYPLGQGPGGFGMGRVGELNPPMPAQQWLEQLMQRLGARVGMVAGPQPELVSTVAVVGGAGGEFLGDAARAGAQVLVTGEARYHQAEAAVQAGVWLVCLGHYETEAVVLEPLAQRIKEGLGVEVEVWDRGGPWQAVLKG